MAKQRNALKAGVFILVSVALILVVAFSITGVRTLIEPMQHRQARFALTDDVGGLRVGDDVRIGGYKVGVVESIDVIDSSAQRADEPPHIVITFCLPTKYTLRQNPRLRIQSTFTNMAWLNFESLGTGSALAADATLAGLQSPMSEIMAELRGTAGQVSALLVDVRGGTIPRVNATVERFGRTADSLASTSDEARSLLGDVRKQVPEIVARYGAVTDRAGEMMVQIRDLFGDIKTDFRATVANLATATGMIREKLPGTMQKLDTVLVNADAALKSASAAMKDIEATAANLKDVSASAKNILAGNKGKIEAMIAGLKATSDNLKGASSEVRHSPWRLLYKPSAGEVSNLNLFDSARQFADGAAELNNAAQALRAAASAENPDEAELKRLMQRLDKSFEKFNSVERKLWDEVKQ